MICLPLSSAAGSALRPQFAAAIDVPEDRPRGLILGQLHQRGDGRFADRVLIRLGVPRVVGSAAHGGLRVQQFGHVSLERTELRGRQIAAAPDVSTMQTGPAKVNQPVTRADGGRGQSVPLVRVLFELRPRCPPGSVVGEARNGGRLEARAIEEQPFG